LAEFPRHETEGLDHVVKWRWERDVHIRWALMAPIRALPLFLKFSAPLLGAALCLASSSAWAAPTKLSSEAAEAAAKPTRAERRAEAKATAKAEKALARAEKALVTYLDTAIGTTEDELNKRMEAIPRPARATALDAERARAAEVPIEKLRRARATLEADIRKQGLVEYLGTHDVVQLVDKNGNTVKSPLIATLERHDPSVIEEAKKWAKANGQPVTVTYSVRVPEEIATAAKAYVKLTGGGHPDALLHGIENPNYEPPHTLFAPGSTGSNAAVHEFIDEVTGTKAKDPKAKAMRAGLEAKIRAGGKEGSPYLRELYRAVVQYAHKDSGHHAQIRLGAEPTESALAGRLQHAVHTLGFEGAVFRHATQQMLTNERIEGVGVTTATVIALPVAGHLIAQTGGQGPNIGKGLIHAGDDFIAAGFDTATIGRTQGWLSAGKYAGYTVAKGGVIVGGSIAAGEVTYKTAKAYAEASGHPEWEVAGKVVKAVFDGVAATGMAFAAERQQANHYAKSFATFLAEGKVPGTDAALYNDTELQAAFNDLPSSELAELHGDKLVEFVKTHHPKLTAPQEENLRRNGAWVAKLPTEKEFWEHARATMNDTSHVTNKQKTLWIPGAFIGGFVSFMVHGHEESIAATGGEHVASTLPLVGAAAAIFWDRRRPVGSLHAALKDHSERVFASDPTHVMRRPALPAHEAIGNIHPTQARAVPKSNPVGRFFRRF
jgi:hypothetical protein